MKTKGKKVFVGLSGGVDSSVSAYLLKQKGYDVTGVFIKAWYPDFLPCNWKSEIRDAMRVCAKLEIPFLVCDLEQEYKKEVIDYLISEYKVGRTPNPDVLCNKEVKFGGFYRFATKLGADFVATGHYSKMVDGEMHIPKDTEKDQTYFLWAINNTILDKILFPLGDLDKSEVRKIAKKNDLHTASKKDSQGLCFIGHVDMKSFLRRYIDTERGDVLDIHGNVIGYHDGSELYTIGERHGFHVETKDGDREVRYVVSKDLENNTITVGDLDVKSGGKNIKLEKVNLFKEYSGEVEFKFRYRGEFVEGEFDGRDSIRVSENISIALGQSIVMYVEGICIGGAVVSGLN